MTVTPNNPQENGEPISPGEPVDAAKAEERERIVKELREAAHGGNHHAPHHDEQLHAAVVEWLVVLGWLACRRPRD